MSDLCPAHWAKNGQKAREKKKREEKNEAEAKTKWQLRKQPAKRFGAHFAAVA